MVQALLVTEVTGDGSSIALITGRPLVYADDGELVPQYDDETVVTTIGADARAAREIALALERHIASVKDESDWDEDEQPTAWYEAWQVLA